MSMMIDIVVTFVVIVISLILLEVYLEWIAKITVDDLFDSEE
tara:strand:+ start:1072 stop:1197 length:126 start_codon:yes stop_codon:yes gene_type:complete